MINDIVENLQVLGPIFAIVWIVTIAFTVSKPQRFFNSMLLIFAIMVTMIFIAGFIPQYAGEFLVGCFILTALALFTVPVFLVINGVQMIKREGFSTAHVLSLVLGIIVGIGEIAAVVFVLGLADAIDITNAELWVLLLVFTVFYFSFLVLSFVLYSVFIQIMPDIDHSNDLLILISHKDQLCGWNASFRHRLRILMLFQEINPFLRIVEIFESAGTVHRVSAVEKLLSVCPDLFAVFHRWLDQPHI